MISSDSWTVTVRPTLGSFQLMFNHAVGALEDAGCAGAPLVLTYINNDGALEFYETIETKYPLKWAHKHNKWPWGFELEPPASEQEIQGRLAVLSFLPDYNWYEGERPPYVPGVGVRVNRVVYFLEYNYERS